MASFRPLLGDLAGSIADNVFSRNTFGPYLRRRATPVNPNTPGQVASRGAFSNASSRWSQTIAQSTRDSWISYAAGTARTNRLGETIFLTGHQSFVAASSLVTRAQDFGATLAQVILAPSTPGLAPKLVPIPGTSAKLGSATSTTGPNSLVIEAASFAGFVPSDPDNVMLWSIGNIIPAGVAFYNGPFSAIGVVQGDATTPPTEVVIATGLVLASGDRVAARVIQVTEQSRISSASSVILTAEVLT
jgi:hypothetical protein